MQENHKLINRLDLGIIRTHDTSRYPLRDRLLYLPIKVDHHRLRSAGDLMLGDTFPLSHSLFIEIRSHSHHIKPYLDATGLMLCSVYRPPPLLIPNYFLFLVFVDPLFNSTGQ